MNPPALAAAAGKRDVDPFRAERLLSFFAFQRLQAATEPLFDKAPEPVEIFAAPRPLFGGNVLEAAQQTGDDPLAPENFDAELFDLGFGVRTADPVGDLLPEMVQRFAHAGPRG